MKKKIFLLTIILSASIFLAAQNFGAIGSNWYYSEHASGNTPENSEYVLLQAVADTIINGITVHKITDTYYQYTGDTLFKTTHYVYEQSDTVYWYDAQQAKFLKLFIFNLSAGDTVTLDNPYPFISSDSLFRVVIDSVNTVVYDGVPLKRFYTTPLDVVNYGYGGVSYMERIGGYKWFLPRAVTIPEAGGPIRCFSDNEIEVNFQSVPCDFLLSTSVKENQRQVIVRIFPNPVQDWLTITSDLPIAYMELYDITGKKQLSTQDQRFNLAHLDNALYLLTIHFTSGEVIHRKITKLSHH